jgi:hypothetical protein
MKAISNPDLIFIIPDHRLSKNADTACMVYQKRKQNREMKQVPNC